MINNFANLLQGKKCFQPKVSVIFKLLDPQNKRLGLGFVLIHAVVLKITSKNKTSLMAVLLDKHLEQYWKDTSDLLTNS